MKKLLCLLFTFMMVAGLFAASPKWKALDMIHPKKLDKTIESFNLICTYKDDAIEVYKNEETSDWMYIYRSGSTENNDQNVWLIVFAYLGGKFDSCTKLSSFSNFKEAVKYLSSAINEESTSILPGDCMGQSKYSWNDPVYIFYYMFKMRVVNFMNMQNIQSIIEIPYSDDMASVFERYEYFNAWLIEHKNVEDTYKKLSKDYKNYLKEHK
ncbi:MAG: hypothetical protein K6A15_08850 [Treponema sp.]|nr:hypothetical protein [Treponema sp.]